MNHWLRGIYRFLFVDHTVGFFRLCLLLLIPAALSESFLRVWLWILVLLQTLILWAKSKGWNEEEK